MTHQVLFHKLGTAPSEDVVVHDDTDSPTDVNWLRLSDDAQYLILRSGARGRPNNDNFKVARLPSGDRVQAADVAWVTVAQDQVPFEYATNVGPRFLFVTRLGAPRGRVVAFDVRRPAAGVAAFVAEAADGAVLEGARGAPGGQLLVHYSRHAASRVEVRDLATGRRVRALALPAGITVTNMEARPRHPDAFLGYHGFLTPYTIVRYDAASGRIRAYAEDKVPGFRPADYVVKQELATSKDGTQVPVFLVHPKSLKLGKDTPTLLYDAFPPSGHTPRRRLDARPRPLSSGVSLVLCSNAVGPPTSGSPRRLPFRVSGPPTSSTWASSPSPTVRVDATIGGSTGVLTSARGLGRVANPVREASEYGNTDRPEGKPYGWTPSRSDESCSPPFPHGPVPPLPPSPSPSLPSSPVVSWT